MSWAGVIEKQKVLSYLSMQLADTTVNYHKSCSGLLPERTFHKMLEQQRILFSLMQLVEKSPSVNHPHEENNKTEYLDLESKCSLLFPQ